VASIRVYLTGQLTVETATGLADVRRLPGRQGRRAFVYLLAERTRPIPHFELAEAVWDTEMPTGWDAALSAIVSKLRRFLADPALGGASVATVAGCYQLRLPPDTWVDIEDAVDALDQAEGLLRRGDHRTVAASATVAYAIVQRSFLPGEEGTWVEAHRVRLHHGLLRALDCLADCWLADGQYELAVDAAARTVALEPLLNTWTVAT
jgi:two-component SAPR family response regulator